EPGHGGNPATYRSNFENETVTPKQWTEGSGWLRTKTYITEVTEVTGQKDYYTHSLKADYPVQIGFTSTNSSNIHITTTTVLLLRATIEARAGGPLAIGTTGGPLLGSGAAAVFNEGPDINVAGDVRLLVEGGSQVGPLNVHAGGNIDITALDNGNGSALSVG